MPNNAPCPCCSQQPFKQCCGRFIDVVSGGLLAKAESPEQLMRSRYSASSLRRAEYLMLTHHPSQRVAGGKQALDEELERTTWLGLKIIDAPVVGGGAVRAEVEFTAFYRPTCEPNLSPQQLHERSVFVFEQDQWFYLNGVIMPPYQLQRNELCWCGRAKKYKKCHGV